MLSCGAALHHCVVALAAMGWQANVHRFPNPAEPEHLAAVKVHRHPATDLDVTLAAAIPRQRTDRRHYSSWHVPAGDTTVMGTRAASSGVMLREVISLPKLRRIVAQAVWQHATDDDYLAELPTWSGQNASVAGVPPATYRPPIRRHRCRADCSPGAALSQPPDTEPADDNAVVLALGTKDDTPLARLRAGEATSLVLLTATAQGLASCPVTEPLEIAETRDAVQTDVFGVSGFPQMLLRIGWAPANADPLPATPRLPLGAVVERLDGSAFDRP
ncbi:Acg family FMN-binding oxidoreductase [Mycolicibacterium chlorophenolicum]|uniref:Putative NAD(P)H nitroreductase n=1 Tax=Mycolicibacterium chlorophenolicum TaxID=37916 RepID=A0A0J6YNM0_9MYCO|nr:putative NAD(P)H nitroreductase [Mycolicibacterium chlorophenolicum]